MLFQTPAPVFIQQAALTPGRRHRRTSLPVGEEGLAANGGNLINKAAGTTETEPATIPIMSGSCTEASQKYPATVGPRSAPIPAARLTSRRPLTGAADVRTAWVWLLVQKNARAIPWTNWDATKKTRPR